MTTRKSVHIAQPSQDLNQILIPTIGPHSIFDSPQKKSMPALREPNSQPFLFSQPRAQDPPGTPKSSFGPSAFMTPRKFDLDFSSGPENMSSPENADNEDTPEPPSKTGAHRNSLFGMYGRFAPSPGRGEIPRLNHYSNALARRVQKRRRRDKALGQQLRGQDSDDDSDRPSSSESKVVNVQKQRSGSAAESHPAGSRMSFSDFFALLEAHPHVPSILSWWAQLVVNLSLFSLAVYVVFGFVSAIRSEFEQAAEEVSDTILAEMATCAKSYVDNRCAGSDRLPALETVCENWERCMNRDPAKVGRAKVSAHTMAIIINSFIDPISWKAIVRYVHPFCVWKIDGTDTTSCSYFSWLRSRPSRSSATGPSVRSETAFINTSIRTNRPTSPVSRRVSTTLPLPHLRCISRPPRGTNIPTRRQTRISTTKTPRLCCLNIRRLGSL